MSQHDKYQNTHVIPVTKMKMETDCTETLPITLDHEHNSDDKVETKSCGKISALISQFNNVDKGSHNTEQDSKIPAKKLRMNFSVIFQEKSNSAPKPTSTISTNCNDHSTNEIQLEKVSLPVVNLTFHIKSAEANQGQKLMPLGDKKLTANEPFVTNAIIGKPLVNHSSFCIFQRREAPNKAGESSITMALPVRLSDLSVTAQTPAIDNDNENKDKCISDFSQQYQTGFEQGDTLNMKSENAYGRQILFQDNKYFVNTVHVNTTEKETRSEKQVFISENENYITNNGVISKLDFAVNGKIMKTVTVPLDCASTNTSKTEPTIAKLSRKIIAAEPLLEQESDIVLQNSALASKALVITNLESKNDEFTMQFQKVKDNADTDFSSTISTSDSGFCDISIDQASDISHESCQRPEPSNRNVRINNMLNMLKSELMSMRKIDMFLLKQMINISQTIQRIRRADELRVSRSMSVLNQNKSLQRRYRPVERQNSAPHCADRRRFLFRNFKASTEDEWRDSLSSLDESEIDSQSELEESSSSLNSIINSSPRSATTRRKFFQSRDMLLSLEITEDTDMNYEDILERNVKFWKMSSQRHQSMQEVAVWF